MPSSYANSFTEPRADFGFAVKSFVQDIIIAVSPEEKRGERIAEFVFDLQKDIDAKTKRGEIVSLDVEDRRKDLMNRFETTVSNTQNGITAKLPSEALTNLKADLELLGELNEIRILYSQFPECLKNCTPEQKDIFNEKVNSLQTWDNKCTGKFNIDDYKWTDASFDDLSKKCPDLQKYDKMHLKLEVSGRV